MKKNKKTALTVTVAVIIGGALIAGGCIMLGKLFGKNGGDDVTETSSPKKNTVIASLDRLLLRESGMRFIREYEIVCDGDTATVAKYGFNYSTGEEKRILEKSVTLETAEVIAKLNEVGIVKWDGFVGSHPKGVKDGTMFDLEAYVNDGMKIRASGSQNFPKNYSDLRNWLYAVIND